MKTNRREWPLGLACALALAGCTIDAYDKGEGAYSLTTAELVEATVGGDKHVSALETDLGERLQLQSPLTASWIQTADTTYRAYLYYNVLENGQVQVVRFGQVGTLLPRDSIAGGLVTDPLHLESAWLARSGKYLNLRLRLMTGSTDDEEAHHTLGLVRDTLASTPAHARLTLYHDQGGRPEYYSSTTYASIPVAAVGADTLTLTVSTYGGPATRTFVLAR